MKTMAVTTNLVDQNTSTINSLDPFRWLAKGWHDFRRTPLLSSAYGLLLAGLFYITVYAIGRVPVLIMSFVTAFFLVAPFLATGIYELSRRLEQGERSSLRAMLVSGKHNFWSIATFGILLALILLAWGRLTGLVIALSFPAVGPEHYLLTWETLLSSESIGFFALLSVICLVLGVLAFATSAISLPLLVDKPVDVITAVAMSWRAVMQNRIAMSVWAMLIMTLTLAGTALPYLGLALILPLLAHATWHAYRSLIASSL